MHRAPQSNTAHATHFIGSYVVVALLLATGCSPESKSNALARIEGKEITIEEFTEQLKRQQSGSPVPLDQRKLFDEMVAKEVLVQSAIMAGLESSPSVQDALQNALISALKEKNLSPKLAAAQVSEEEVKAGYESQQDRFTQPERSRLAILFAETQGGSSIEARQRLEAVLTQAKNEPSKIPLAQGFGPLAMNFSDDQESRYKGGDIGWIERERFPQRLEKAVIEAGLKLQELGEMSEVITGKKGLYLVKLIGREVASRIPIEKVAPNIRQELLLAKQNQIEGDFQQALRESLRTEIYPERLNAIPKSSPSKEPAPPNFR